MEELIDECIPIMGDASNRSILPKAIFYMFWRIKELKLEDALVHLDPELSDLWKTTWSHYEINVKHHRLKEKLGITLLNNFTDEELKELGNIKNFNFSPDKYKDAKRP